MLADAAGRVVLGGQRDDAPWKPSPVMSSSSKQPTKKRARGLAAAASSSKRSKRTEEVEEEQGIENAAETWADLKELWENAFDAFSGASLSTPPGYQAFSLTRDLAHASYQARTLRRPPPCFVGSSSSATASSATRSTPCTLSRRPALRHWQPAPPAATRTKLASRLSDST